MNRCCSALLISWPKFNLFCSGSAESQLFGPVPIDCFFLLLLLNLLIVWFFIEDTGLIWVGIIYTENSMPPPSLDDPVSLSKEDLLRLQLIELLQLGFDILEFLSSFPRHSHLSRVHHELSLCILEMRDLFIYLLDMMFSLRFVKQRLLCSHLLESGYALSFLKGGGSIILVNVDFLCWVFSIHRHEWYRWAHHWWIHRVRATLKWARLRIVNASIGMVLWNWVIKGCWLGLWTVLRCQKWIQVVCIEGVTL